MVLFANDGPLGVLKSDANSLPQTLWGNWQDLTWIGYEIPASSPHISALMGTLFSPEVFLKIYPPFALFFLGLSAWFCLRQLGFYQAVCILGGLAAALNENTFSNVCWGQSSRAFAQAAAFLAIGLIAGSLTRFTWAKIALAGLAVGLGVMEGFDVGALYSLYVAAFALFLFLIQPGKVGQNLSRGVVKIVVVALFAGFISAHTLRTLLETQGRAVVQVQKPKTPEEERAQWDFATQWSLPKIETFRVIIPGLFGYRMDTPEGGQYW
ncbi:MAG: hypothetical protein ACK4UN_22445, partial [Limisphaerales bacterium]